MACQSALCSTETLDFCPTFGEVSKRAWEHAWSLGQHIIHRLMDNQRGRFRFSKTVEGLHIMRRSSVFAEFAHNYNYQASIKMAPFEALYERRCRFPLCWDNIGDKKLLGLEIITQTVEKVKTISYFLLPWYELYFFHRLVHGMIKLSLIYSFSHVIIVYTYHTRAHFLILHTHWELSGSSGFAHSDIGCFVLLTRCWWECMPFKEPEVSLCLITGILSFLFIPVISLFFLYHYRLPFHLCVYLLSCVDIYMCYCSDRDLL